MPVRADVSQMKRVIKEVRAVKDRELTKALTKGINSAVEPAKDAFREAARADLPHKGGLAEYVARASFRVQRNTGKSPGVILFASQSKQDGGRKMDLRKMDGGAIRHKVYGKAWAKKTQRIPKDLFTRKWKKLQPRITRDINAAVSEVAKTLAERSKT